VTIEEKPREVKKLTSSWQTVSAIIHTSWVSYSQLRTERTPESSEKKCSSSASVLSYYDASPAWEIMHELV
jgi:hypothetical protein